MANQTFDPEKFQLSLARLKKGGNDFEVVIDPDLYVEYKDGLKEPLDIIQSNDIFADAQKGQLAPHELWSKTFDSSDQDIVVVRIINEGSIHLPLSYKQKLRDNKKKQILQLLHTNGVDPRTNIPHPLNRIEAAVESAKVRIDEFLSAKDQVKDILKKLQPILPIRFEQKEMKIHVPAQYAHSSYGIIKKSGDVKHENWNNDGSLEMIIVIPGGAEESLYDKMNSLTHGSIQIEVLNILR